MTCQKPSRDSQEGRVAFRHHKAGALKRRRGVVFPSMVVSPKSGPGVAAVR